MKIIRFQMLRILIRMRPFLQGNHNETTCNFDNFWRIGTMVEMVEIFLVTCSIKTFKMCVICRDTFL